MSKTVTASIGWRWWVRWYLRAVVWFARAGAPGRDFAHRGEFGPR
ncbi:hypothetical protein [Stenotrophomonas nitritireducens]|nr:hypothetical protein [Stenotrophomonas nitritireducens]